MRKRLDAIYDAAMYLAALCMVGVLGMVLASVVGRLLDFNLRGSDAYAGYFMAAASFLALAHTLKRGEHIRVTLILDRLGQRRKHALEIWCHVVGTLICVVLVLFSARLVWQSWSFHDVSQGNDATPLWIPQISMAVGTAVLLLAMADDLILYLRGHDPRPPKDALEELKLVE